MAATACRSSDLISLAEHDELENRRKALSQALDVLNERERRISRSCAWPKDRRHPRQRRVRGVNETNRHCGARLFS
jgi:hypothetical protein